MEEQPPWAREAKLAVSLQLTLLYLSPRFGEDGELQLPKAGAPRKVLSKGITATGPGVHQTLSAS